jgi:hypothetical protein
MDVRFVLSRAVVLGILATIVAACIGLIDWLFSTRFTNSRSETAVYAGIALIVGLLLNTVRQRITTVVDRLFFHNWYRTEIQSKAVGDSMHRATSRSDVYELLTTGLLNAYYLASAALFERLPDGGFVRVAARGWPTGALWHLLPDDPAAKRARTLRPTNLDAIGWKEEALPKGVARPSLMVPIFAGRRVSAALLCGAHENGTALDPDEVSAIRRLCAQAGLIYGGTAAFEKAVVPQRPTESLGAEFGQAT